MSDVYDADIRRYTPGPWKVGRMILGVTAGNNKVIAHCYLKSKYASMSDLNVAAAEAEGNACLISAAPDFLDAAKTLIAKAATVGPHFLEDDLSPLVAAIEKAEGRRA